MTLYCYLCPLLLFFIPGVEPVKAAAIAGGLAIAGVITDLAREFLKDGDLTLAEVDEVFKKASKGKGGK